MGAAMTEQNDDHCTCLGCGRYVPLADMNGHDIEVPDDLAADVTARIAGTADSWDDALLDIVQEGAS